MKKFAKLVLLEGAHEASLLSYPVCFDMAKWDRMIEGIYEDGNVRIVFSMISYGCLKFLWQVLLSFVTWAANINMNMYNGYFHKNEWA